MGCGLISIGRKWATHNAPLSHEEAIIFLKKAFRSGIHFFDTAPSYGNSELKLSKFLSNLKKTERNQIKVATKFGEHWDHKKNEPYVNHSYQACKKSIDHSIQLLNKIDILQLHKTTPEILRSDNFHKIVEYAKLKKIPELGVSVTDLDSTKIACSMEFIDWIQVPFNQDWIDQERALNHAISRGKKIIINRPFNSGKLFNNQNEKKENIIKKSLKMILKKDFTGHILFGTRNIDHLKQNIDMFNKIVNQHE